MFYLILIVTTGILDNALYINDGDKQHRIYSIKLFIKQEVKENNPNLLQNVGLL